MKLLAILILSGCAAMPDCLPKTSLHREGRKVDGAFVGAYCNDKLLDKLERMTR